MNYFLRDTLCPSWVNIFTSLKLDRMHSELLRCKLREAFYQKAVLVTWSKILQLIGELIAEFLIEIGRLEAIAAQINDLAALLPGFVFGGFEQPAPMPLSPAGWMYPEQPDFAS